MHFWKPVYFVEDRARKKEEYFRLPAEEPRAKWPLLFSLEKNEGAKLYISDYVLLRFYYQIILDSAKLSA